MTPEDFKRKLTAILSADVVGYSKLMGDDEAATVKTLETYKGVMFSLIRQHRGRVVDSPGDNLLADFGSVVDAVQCGVSIQKELQTRNAELLENRKMVFRIGINLGDVIEEEDRIYGDGVNIAARLETLADPGGICISKTAFLQIESKLPLGYEFLGDQTVKNIAKPVGAYKVLMETRVVDAKTKREAKAVSFWRKKSVLSVAVIIILCGVGIWYFSFRQEPADTEKTHSVAEHAASAPEVKEVPKTIAVLPFENLSSDPEQKYFVDGLSEEILNSLTKIPDLYVTSRTSSFYFRNTDTTIQKIADVLNVSYILEGSVRKAGDDLRITAQLIRVADDRHLWSETYDRKLKDIFAVQENIAKAVTNKLKVTLGVGSLKQLGGTDNVEAYSLYLRAKGMAFYYSTGDALEIIERAIANDPEFALAWVMKAVIQSFWVTGESDKGRLTSLLDAGLSAALRSIEIEPNLAAGYASVGLYRTIRSEWIDAELAYRTAFKLATEPITTLVPQIPTFYMAIGSMAKAKGFFEEIKQNDPLNAPNYLWYAYCLALLGDIQGAEKEMQRCKEMLASLRPQDADWGLSIVKLGTGASVYSEEIVFYDQNTDVFAQKEQFESPEEGLMELRRLYNNGDKLLSFDLMLISILAAHFGDSHFAMNVMEKVYDLDATLVHALWLPVMKEVRQLPRFKEFLKEIGLIDYWEQFGWPDICRPLENGDFECDWFESGTGSEL